jgi:hypothetical protein
MYGDLKKCGLSSPFYFWNTTTATFSKPHTWAKKATAQLLHLIQKLPL